MLAHSIDKLHCVRCLHKNHYPEGERQKKCVLCQEEEKADKSFTRSILADELGVSLRYLNRLMAYLGDLDDIQRFTALGFYYARKYVDKDIRFHYWLVNYRDDIAMSDKTVYGIPKDT